MNLTNLFAVSCTPTEKSGCDTNWEGDKRLEENTKIVFFVCVCVCVCVGICCNAGLYCCELAQYSGNQAEAGTQTNKYTLAR